VPASAGTQLKKAGKHFQLGNRESRTDSVATSKDPMGDLRRELEVMCALDHKNIVRLNEVIHDADSGKVKATEPAAAGATAQPGRRVGVPRVSCIQGPRVLDSTLLACASCAAP
jgi:hypothetical protein